MNLLRAIVKREKKVLYHYEGVVYPKDRMLHKILNDPSSETGMGLAQVSPAVESSGILLPPSIAWDWTNWSDRVAAMSMMMLGQIDEERAVSKPYPSNSSPITIESNGSESLDSLCSVVSPSLPGSHDQRNPPDSTRILNTQFEFPTIQCRQTFVCEICDKEFDRKSNMNKHIRHVHEKLRPYICRLCGKKFGQKSSIDKHVIVVHEKRRIHKCDLCGSRFGQVGDLNVHVRTVHEKKRPYGCATCGATFGLRSHLNKHLRVVHERQRPHSCTICSASFGEKSDLRKHEKSLHNP
mmetsp:Transcript_12431/g.25298  ORF Transcript_12431/g.25298 Transcript_12431/m.25298 type:complete len:295 (-) Transcript_12431:130-1014(-)